MILLMVGQMMIGFGGVGDDSVLGSSGNDVMNGDFGVLSQIPAARYAASGSDVLLLEKGLTLFTAMETMTHCLAKQGKIFW
jgi:hypothetical protein